MIRTPDDQSGLSLVVAWNGHLARFNTGWKPVLRPVFRSKRKSYFVDTITDEDRLPHYKIFASRFEVEG
jgi:hypothetical protein